MTPVLNPVRCILTGAVAVPVFFVLCWLGAAAVPVGPSHMFIALFTAQPVASVAALTEGGLWSLAFGALSGALIAVVYNLFGFLDRRSS